MRCDDNLFRGLILINYEAFQQPVEAADIAYSVARPASGGFRISRGQETLAEVTSDEAELIRAIADAIGCPIPPFVKMRA